MCLGGSGAVPALDSAVSFTLRPCQSQEIARIVCNFFVFSGGANGKYLQDVVPKRLRDRCKIDPIPFNS